MAKFELFNNYQDRYADTLLVAGVYDSANVENAAYLVANGHAVWLETPPSGEEESDNTPDFSAMSVKELTELLTEKGIEIPAGAKKFDLIKLLELQAVKESQP